MAKTNMSGFDRDMKKVFAELEKPELMKELGDAAAERLVKRTRLGRGVAEPEGESFPLKPLSDGYKEARKKNKGDLSELTSPGKSNLTRTSQMLSSIKALKPNRGTIKIAPTGKRSESNLTNEDVAGYVSRERPFLNLSKPEVAGLTRLVREKIDEILSRLGLTNSR